MNIILEKARNSIREVTVNGEYQYDYKQLLDRVTFPDYHFKFSRHQNAYVAFLDDLMEKNPRKGIAHFPDGSSMFIISVLNSAVLLVFEAGPHDTKRLTNDTMVISATAQNNGLSRVKAFIIAQDGNSMIYQF